MNKDTKQKISQFLDDELPPSELGSLLLTLKKQPELKNTMDRYQMASQIMKADEGVVVKPLFLAGINKQLEQEPHYFLPKKVVSKKQLSYWKMGSVAVAASFAMVAVIFSVQNQPESLSGKADAVFMAKTQQINLAESVQVQVQQTLENKVQVNVASLNKPQINKATQLTQHQRLKAYLQAHNDDLYTYGSLNYQPYARVASFGQE